MTDNFNEKITLRLIDIDAQNAINAVLGSSRKYEISVFWQPIQYPHSSRLALAPDRRECCKLRIAHLVG